MADTAREHDSKLDTERQASLRGEGLASEDDAAVLGTHLFLLLYRSNCPNPSKIQSVIETIQAHTHSLVQMLTTAPLPS